MFWARDLATSSIAHAPSKLCRKCPGWRECRFSRSWSPVTVLGTPKAWRWAI